MRPVTGNRPRVRSGCRDRCDAGEHPRRRLAVVGGAARRGVRPGPRRAVRRRGQSPGRGPRAEPRRRAVLEFGAMTSVAIVGAGMSGLCMAIKLRQAGFEDFAIFEKASDVGGTWRENRYPGLTCDVPARYYSYSFAPNPDWSRVMAPGPEIWRYFKGL